MVEQHFEYLNRDFLSVELTEQMNDLANAVSRAEWVGVDGIDADKISWDTITTLDSKISDMIGTNALFARAVQVLYGYVFGRGLILPDSQPRKVEKFVSNVFNKEALFDTEGWYGILQAICANGNLFIAVNKKTGLITRLPTSELHEFYGDPNSKERVWYVKRTWGTTKQKTVWYPTYGAVQTGVAKNKSLKGHSVVQDEVVFSLRWQRHTGATFGVPMALPAIIWGIAYSGYLKNNAQMVRSLSTIALKITNLEDKIAKNTAFKFTEKVGGETGQVASLPKGADLVSMPGGANVNFTNGSPLASMVASVFGISKIDLLADPSAGGSTYNASQALTPVTIRVVTIIQKLVLKLFREIWDYMGGTKSEMINFPAVETDAVYRQITSLTLAYTTGAIDQAEYRKTIIPLLDIIDVGDINKLPKPDAFNSGDPKKYLEVIQLIQSIISGNSAESNTDGSEDDTADDPLPSQGNSGAVGSMNFDGNDYRDNGDYN